MLVRVTGVFGLGLVLVALGAGAVHAADPQDLAGRYQIKGFLNGKPDYEQSAEIVFKKGTTVEVTLKDGKETWIGLGKLEGDTLKITAFKAEGKGRMVWEYEVKKNGHLVAEWKDGGKAWKETWTKQK